MAEDEPAPSKMRKIHSVTDTSNVSSIDHRSSDTEKYKIFTSTQTFDKKFQFPQQQCGMKTSGKPHMCSFSSSWLDEFQQDGLVYSVKDDAAYCKFCRLFPGGEWGMLVEKPFKKWKSAI